MTDITEMETAELEHDLLMSIANVLLCDRASAEGYTFYSGVSVPARREISLNTIEKIHQELLNREIDEEYENIEGIGFEPG